MTNPFEAIQSQLDRLEHLVVQLLNREPAQPAGGPEEPIPIKRVAELLTISIGAVYQSKEIPRHKRNGRLLFFESEILDYIKNGPSDETVMADMAQRGAAQRRPRRNRRKIPL